MRALLLSCLFLAGCATGATDRSSLEPKGIAEGSAAGQPIPTETGAQPASYWDFQAGKPVLYEPTAKDFMNRINGFHAGVTEADLLAHWWCKDARKTGLSTGGATLFRVKFYTGGIYRVQLWRDNGILIGSENNRWELLDHNRILRSFGFGFEGRALVKLDVSKTEIIYFRAAPVFACDDSLVYGSDPAHPFPLP